MSTALILGIMYLKSWDGILKLVQLAASVIGVAITTTSDIYIQGVVFTVAGVGSIVTSCLFILTYVTHLAGKFPKLLIQVELHFAWLWGIFYIIVSSYIIGTSWPPYIAAGVFGLLATIAYFCDGILKYKMK